MYIGLGGIEIMKAHAHTQHNTCVGELAHLASCMCSVLLFSRKSKQPPSQKKKNMAQQQVLQFLLPIRFLSHMTQQQADALIDAMSFEECVAVAELRNAMEYLASSQAEGVEMWRFIVPGQMGWPEHHPVCRVAVWMLS